MKEPLDEAIGSETGHPLSSIIDSGLSAFTLAAISKAVIELHDTGDWGDK